MCILAVGMRVRRKACMKRGVRVCRSQLEVVPRNSAGGGRPMSTVSAGGSLGRGSRALHLQHHQSSLSALHMTANHTGTVDRRRSSLRVTYRIDLQTWSIHDCTGYSSVLLLLSVLSLQLARGTSNSRQIASLSSTPPVRLSTHTSCLGRLCVLYTMCELNRSTCELGFERVRLGSELELRGEA